MGAGIGIGEALIIGVVLVFVLGGFVVTWFTIWRPMMKKAGTLMDTSAAFMQAQASMMNLRTVGMPASARILAVQQTGAMVNFQPQCRVDLEVFPAAGGPYRATVMALVPQMAIPRVQPGLIVPIRVDPMNPMAIALDV